MYCQRHRPTPPPGYGGIAFGKNPPDVPEKTQTEEMTKREDGEPVINLPVPALPPKTDGEGTRETENPGNAEKNEKREAGNEQMPLLGALLREKWSLEDLVTAAALLLIISGQADDGILLLVGLLLLIGGEGVL